MGADPPLSALRPNLVSIFWCQFWCQTRQFFRLLPVPPVFKTLATTNLPYLNFHGMEEVVGSILTRSTIFSSTYNFADQSVGSIW
jgi:hypothetical protein